VAITSGCAVLEPWAAIVVGMIAGLIYLFSYSMLERLRIDDAVNAIPVHMCNGIWGMLATGLLASPRLLRITYENDDNPGLFYSFSQGEANATLVACQLVAILFIVGWTMVTMLPFFFWLNYRGWFRADSYEEIIGLDISYHGGSTRSTVDDGVGIQFIEAHRRVREKEKRYLHGSHGRGADELESGKATNKTTDHSMADLDDLIEVEPPFVSHNDTLEDNSHLQTSQEEKLSLRGTDSHVVLQA